jgi:hypothetical protein
METELKMPEYEAGNITYEYVGSSIGIRPVKYVGVYFQLVNVETVRECIVKWKNDVLPIISSAPVLTIEAPCGEKVMYKTIDDVPEVDVPCSCGNPNHWFIKIERK